MKLNHGRVSACIEVSRVSDLVDLEKSDREGMTRLMLQEWKKFRQCHEQGKATHKSVAKRK